MTDPAIRTEPFRITPAAYLRVTAAGVFSRLLLWMALLLAACGAMAAFADVRWLLVGLIVLFLVFPFALFHIYFTRLLTPETRKCLALKRLEIAPVNYIRIIYISADEENSPAPLPEERIGWHDITRIYLSGKYLAVNISDLSQPLLIPISSIPDDFDYRSVITSHF